MSGNVLGLGPLGSGPLGSLGEDLGASIATDAATLALAVADSAPVPGAVTISTDPAALTLTAEDSALFTSTALATDPAVLALAVADSEPLAGAVAVATDPAGITVGVADSSPSAGPVVLETDAAGLTLAVADSEPSEAFVVSTDAAQLVLAVSDSGLIPGAVTISTDAVQLVLSVEDSEPFLPPVILPTDPVELVLVVSDSIPSRETRVGSGPLLLGFTVTHATLRWGEMETTMRFSNEQVLKQGSTLTPLRGQIGFPPGTQLALGDIADVRIHMRPRGASGNALIDAAIVDFQILQNGDLMRFTYPWEVSDVGTVRVWEVEVEINTTDGRKVVAPSDSRALVRITEAIPTA